MRYHLTKSCFLKVRVSKGIYFLLLSDNVHGQISLAKDTIADFDGNGKPDCLFPVSNRFGGELF